MTVHERDLHGFHPYLLPVTPLGRFHPFSLEWRLGLRKREDRGNGGLLKLWLWSSAHQLGSKISLKVFRQKVFRANVSSPLEIFWEAL